MTKTVHSGNSSGFEEVLLETDTTWTTLKVPLVGSTWRLSSFRGNGGRSTKLMVTAGAGALGWATTSRPAQVHRPVPLSHFPCAEAFTYHPILVHVAAKGTSDWCTSQRLLGGVISPKALNNGFAPAQNPTPDKNIMYLQVLPFLLVVQSNSSCAFLPEPLSVL